MLREIAGRRVGPAHPVFVIAEIGLNHSGSPARALEMVDAAARAGASAVKLQTLDAAALVAPACPPPAHVQAASLRDFFARFELDADAHAAVARRARERGLAVMATPFSIGLVELLEAVPVDAYKIASGDLTYDGLIQAVAATGRPVVISTGMSTLPETARAVRVARRAGADQVAVLHCVSAYPAPVGSENLRAIPSMASSLAVPVGLSDHGSGLHAPVAAVALGATLYERHLVLDGDRSAIDAPVSSTPEDLRTRIVLMENARLALGDGEKVCQPAEQPNLQPSRRGLYAGRAIRAGHVIEAGDVAVLRPANGLLPRDLPALTGTRALRDIPAGDPFEPRDLELERAS